VEAKLESHTKQDLIEMVHKAKCMKLKGLNVDSMTKEEIVKHLVDSKCPEIMKLVKLKA